MLEIENLRKKYGDTEVLKGISFTAEKGEILGLLGPNGTGKSTTMTAFIVYINNNFEKHIITIEDPVEFVHENKKCLINQREIPTLPI